MVRLEKFYVRLNKRCVYLTTGVNQYSRLHQLGHVYTFGYLGKFFLKIKDSTKTKEYYF